MAKVLGLGIDGCRGGWLVCRLFEQQRLDFHVLNHIQQIEQWAPLQPSIFIDMPFGLSENQQRLCDKLARQLLGNRRATIFFTPCRAAVYAGTYQQACQLNLQLCRQKISKQAWNLVPKIRQLDQFLLTNPGWQAAFWESHPELCFRWLNRNITLQTSKQKVEGQQQRLALLQKYLPVNIQHLHNWRKKLGASQVRLDDLLDALVLAFCAAQPSHKRFFIPPELTLDNHGLRMNIVCLR